MLGSADDPIGATQITAEKLAYVHQHLLLEIHPDPRPQSVDQFARGHALMPMLVARSLSDQRPNDQALSSLIATNEFLIKSFGKKSMPREFVEGTLVKSDKFWRHNDPLGVYQPGDMFYVDDNHPLRNWFPVLILAPTAFVVLLFLIAISLRFLIR